jgi:hypothetical protein
LFSQVEAKLRSATDAVQDLQEDAVSRARAAGRVADDYVSDNPWQMVGVAAAVGFPGGRAAEPSLTFASGETLPALASRRLARTGPHWPAWPLVSALEETLHAEMGADLFSDFSGRGFFGFTGARSKLQGHRQDPVLHCACHLSYRADLRRVPGHTGFLSHLRRSCACASGNAA